MLTTLLLKTALLSAASLIVASTNGVQTPIEVGGIKVLPQATTRIACETDNNMADPDKDNLLNMYERFFNSDPCVADTDGDGYLDGDEVSQGFSPTDAGLVRIDTQDRDQDGLVDIKEVEFLSNPFDPDTDDDGLNDWEEFRWQTTLTNPDTDGDGVLDGDEVTAYTNPLGDGSLEKKIEVDLKNQKISYLLGDQVLGTFIISSGKPGYDTPTGEFQIHNKHPRAYSRSYGLYMPYWMAFTANGLYGFHELPEWPNGYKEGEDHLGTPVSHGCVRLGAGPAKILYDFADIGTKVVIR